MICDDFSKLPIYLVGAGNVATHLGTAFYKNGIIIKNVWSKNIENASTLSKKINSKFSNKLTDICNEKAIFLICVPDNAIQEIAKTISNKNSVIIHTSGSTNISVLNCNSTNYGVLYPLQTFSKTDTNINFKEIPIFIESSNNKVNELLINLCITIGSKSIYSNSEQRLKIHISAVFANNFVNHMMAIAYELSIKNNIDFELLKPLISKTFEKLKIANPKELQTGPAIRNDSETIKKHLISLSNNPDFAKIYSFVSKSIFKMHKK